MLPRTIYAHIPFPDVLRANGIAPQLPREKRKASHGSEEDEGIEIVDVKPEKDEDVLDLSDGETDVEKISALKVRGNFSRCSAKTHMALAGAGKVGSA